MHAKREARAKRLEGVRKFRWISLSHCFSFTASLTESVRLWTIFVLVLATVINLKSSVAATKITSEKVAVLWSQTQAGKSTFTRHISGNHSIPVGNNSGGSVTTSPTVYTFATLNNVVLHLMDTPGSEDTLLRWKPEDILNTIEYAVTKISNFDFVDAILVVESLATDKQQLQNNLNRLKIVFGNDVMRTVIVLGTKPRLSRKMFGETRIVAVQELCEKLSLPFVIYEAHDEEEKNQESLVRLIAGEKVMIGTRSFQVQSFRMDKVQETREKIRQRANELMEAAPKQYETVKKEREKEVLKPYEVEETYITKKWGVVGRGGRRYLIAGPRRRIYGWIPEEKTRTVTKYRPGTQMVTEEIVVEVPHDFAKFMEQAQNEWEGKVRHSLVVPLQTFGTQIEKSSCAEKNGQCV